MEWQASGRSQPLPGAGWAEGPPAAPSPQLPGPRRATTSPWQWWSTGRGSSHPEQLPLPVPKRHQLVGLLGVALAPGPLGKEAEEDGLRQGPKGLPGEAGAGTPYLSG